MTVAENLCQALNTAIDHRGEASLVLAGGNTFVPVYRLLKEREYQEKVPWSYVTLYFGDERAVPFSDQRSNASMVFDCWLNHLDDSNEPKVFCIEGEQRPQKAADRYEAILPTSFDVVLLGIGPDGHTASLFPSSMASLPEGRRVAVTEAELPPPVPRITLTPLALNACETMIIAVSGAAKAPIMAELAKDTHKRFPASQVAPKKAKPIWIIDSEAAKDM